MGIGVQALEAAGSGGVGWGGCVSVSALGLVCAFPPLPTRSHDLQTRVRLSRGGGKPWRAGVVHTWKEGRGRRRGNRACWGLGAGEEPEEGAPTPVPTTWRDGGARSLAGQALALRLGKLRRVDFNSSR